MAYKQKQSSCAKMVDAKGKPSGLMMAGSVAHMESALQHAGKSKLHAKPEKDYPDDGHLHYQDGKKVESPGVSETNKLSDTSGAIGQMSPYKFTGMSGGSAMHAHGPGGSHPTTSLKNALASDEDYQVVPGYEQRLGGELEGVTVTAPAKDPKSGNNKKKNKPGGEMMSHTGRALRLAGTFITGNRYKRRQLEKTASKGVF